MMKITKKTQPILCLLLTAFLVLTGCSLTESESFRLNNYNEFYVNNDGSIGTNNTFLLLELREKYGTGLDNSIKRCIEWKEQLNMRCEETIAKIYWRMFTFQIYGSIAKLLSIAAWLIVIAPFLPSIIKAIRNQRTRNNKNNPTEDIIHSQNKHKTTLENTV